MNGKIYAIGGSTYYGKWPATNGIVGTNEEYDPEMDTWETKASRPTARWLLQANVVNGKIYLIGGQNSGLSSTKVNEVYDPLTDSWSMKAPIPTAVSNYASAVVDNKIYVAGGFFCLTLPKYTTPRLTNGN